MQYQIAQGNYTHIFTNSEIMLSKKFKKNVFNNYYFANYLYLFAINQIYLMEQ